MKMVIPEKFECEDVQRDKIQDWLCEEQMEDRIGLRGKYADKYCNTLFNWASLLNFLRSHNPRLTMKEICEQIKVTQPSLSKTINNDRFKKIHSLLFPGEELPIQLVRSKKGSKIDNKIKELEAKIKELEKPKEETLESLEKEAKKEPKPIPEWAKRIYESVGNRMDRDKLLKEKSFEEKQKENRETREAIKEVIKKNPEVS
jgi:hypothetical protein